MTKDKGQLFQCVQLITSQLSFVISKLSGGSGGFLLHERFGVVEDLVGEVERFRFAVEAQHGLGAGSAEEQPGLDALLRFCVEVELYAVDVLAAQHFVGSYRG